MSPTLQDDLRNKDLNHFATVTGMQKSLMVGKPAISDPTVQLLKGSSISHLALISLRCYRLTDISDKEKGLLHLPRLLGWGRALLRLSMAKNSKPSVGGLPLQNPKFLVSSA